MFNQLKSVNKAVALLVTLGLLCPSSAYSARQTGTVQSPNVLDLFSRALLLSGSPRSEVRDIRFGFEKTEKYFTNSYASYKVGNVFKKTVQQIPDEVVNEIKSALANHEKAGRIRSSIVHDFAGTDIDIHVTQVYGEMNASIHRLMLDAIRQGLGKAQDLKLLNVDIKALSNDELVRRLNIRTNDDSKVERPAESVVIAKGIGVGIGAANIKLYHEFAVPHSTPLQKLGLSKSPGFRFRVKRTQDILTGNFNGPEWEFEISEDQRDKDGKVTIPGVNVILSWK